MAIGDPAPLPPGPVMGAVPAAPLPADIFAAAPDVEIIEEPEPDLGPALLELERPEAPLPTVPVGLDEQLLAAPPLPEPVRRGARAEDTGRAWEQSQEQLGRLRAGQNELLVQYAAEKDPATRDALAKRIAAIDMASQGVQGKAEESARSLEEQAATSAAQRQVEQARAQEVALAEESRRADELAQEFAAREAQRDEARGRARERMTTDREAMRALIQRGPQQANLALTFGSMFAEAVRASKAREVPNFDAIIQRAAQQSQAEFAAEMERAGSLVELTGDELADAAQQERDDNARHASAKAAIAEELERQLAQQAASATTEAARIQAAQALPQLQATRQRLEAEAAAAHEDRELKRAEALGKMRAQEATTRKTEAESGLAERKLARAGMGGRKAGPGLIAPNVVTVPDSDTPLVTFANDAQGRKEAEATRAIVGAQTNAIDTINRVLALYEDAEQRGILATAGWERSDAYSDLEAELAMLETQMAFVRAGGGKTSQGDDEWAKTVVPASPKAWTSKKKALGDIRALRRVIENQSRNTLASSTRLDKATRERIIASARPKGISRRRLAEAEQLQAAQDLTSPETSTPRKLTAIEQVEAQARIEHGDDDWLPIATAQLSDALRSPAVRDDPEVRAKVRETLARYERFGAERGERATFEAEKLSWADPGFAPRQEAERKAERTGATTERARMAQIEDTIRAMSPDERAQWRLLPGVADVIDRIEAEEQ